MGNKTKNSMVELCEEYGIRYVITNKYISVLNDYGESAVFTDYEQLAEWIGVEL